jgi:hypothetical protein
MNISYFRYIIFFSSIIITYPFVFDFILGFNGKVFSGILAIIMLLDIIANNKKIKIKSFYFNIYVLLNIFFSFMLIYHKDLEFIIQILQFNLISIIIIYLNLFLDKKQIIKILVKFMTLISKMGILLFFLLTFGIINNPLSKHVQIESIGRVLENYILNFTNYSISLGNIKFIRLGGYFEEPGLFALLIIFTIILNNLYEVNKNADKWLNIAGFLTFSLAYFITIPLYYLISIKKLNFKKTIITLSIVLIIVLMLFNLDTNLTNYIYQRSIQRIENFLIKGISATNRSSSINKGISLIKENPLFGLGISKVNNLNYDRSSIIGLITQFGLLGILIYYLHHILILKYIIYKKDEKLLLNTYFLLINFIIIINYFHRPVYLSVLQTLFLYFIYEKMIITKLKIKKT